jgi:hypothetical protein
MNLWLPGHRLTMTADGRWSSRPSEKLQHRFSTKNSNMHRPSSEQLTESANRNPVESNQARTTTERKRRTMIT